MDPITMVGLASGASNVLGTIGNFFNQNRAYDQQAEYNKLQMQREDTAYQRKVADLKAAGLSPMLAVGSGGSASAPAHVGQAPQIDTDKLNALSMVQQVMAGQQMKEQVAQTRAQTELIEAQKLATIAGIANSTRSTNAEVNWKNKQTNAYDMNTFIGNAGKVIDMIPGLGTLVKWVKPISKIFRRR